MTEDPTNEAAGEREAQSGALFRSGFIALVGPANAGKSTLLNALVGAKVAIEHSAQSGKGKLVVTYNSLDELDGILAHIH